MSTDSEEEEIPKFRPGEHDPVEFYEAMELRVADKKDMSATRMLGVLARHMEDRADAKALMKWKKLATMPGSAVGVSTATTDELMDTFVET
jgi:hypothetical protein